jgi:LPXTG-site transpeptidase (sortase) family protein
MRKGYSAFLIGNRPVIQLFLLAFSILAILLGTLPVSSPRLANAMEAVSRLGAIQLASLASAQAEPLAELGWAVAISGNTAVVGARNEDFDRSTGALTNAGAAYVFVRSGSSWFQEAKLVPRDPNTGDTFGVSVAIDGNTIVVGATGSDPDDLTDAGAAYVFLREGINWTQKAKLVPLDPAAEDNFGSSVAIDGDTILVGADNKDLLINFDAGAVYVFVHRGNSWDQKAKLVASDARPGAYFGSAVALDGNTAVIGATEANPAGLRGPGAAYVFEGRGNSWQQEARLAAEEGRRGDFFGHSVDIWGETIAVGSIFSDPEVGDARQTNAGAVYVFSSQRGDWEQETVLVPERATPFGQFGQSLALEGNRIIVGADREPQSGTSATGAAYLFVQTGKEWIQHTRFVPDTVGEDDSFGKSIGISGDYAIVGASGRDPGSVRNAGEAIIYRFIPVQLPETGFPPGRITSLPPQPAGLSYAELGDLWLEIPQLAVQASIVGVPQAGSGWETGWLGARAGYLEGTAFPTWEGNTGIAGHSYLPDGSGGPFRNLAGLGWGDKVFIHAWGLTYVYEVREVLQVSPTDLEVLRHEDYDWITLIGCTDYQDNSNQFSQRVIVRAVLTAIEEE